MYTKIKEILDIEYDYRPTFVDIKGDIWVTMIHGGKYGTIGYYTGHQEFHQVLFTRLRDEISFKVGFAIPETTVIHIMPCHPAACKRMYDYVSMFDPNIKIEGNWEGVTYISFVDEYVMFGPKSFSPTAYFLAINGTIGECIDFWGNTHPILEREIMYAMNVKTLHIISLGRTSDVLVEVRLDQ